MIKAIKGLCRFSREHGIIKKKKRVQRSPISHPGKRLMLSVSYLFTAFAREPHRHTVLFQTAGPTPPTCSLPYLTSRHLSSHLTFEETRRSPPQRCARASRVPAPLPTCSQLSPPARGWVSHRQQHPDMGSFLSFFLARKGRAASGKACTAAEIPAPNLGGPPKYDSVCVKRPPRGRGTAPWQLSRNH